MNTTSKRDKVLACLSDPKYSGMSNRVIAEQCGAGRSTVNFLRLEHEGSAIHPTKRVGKDGTSQSAKKVRRVVRTRGLFDAIEPWPTLTAPFPMFGGKGPVADEIWRRFGNVRNYLEPFGATLANMLRRPADHFTDGHRIETVNDVNHFISNFWRAVQHAPDEVARWADYPVIEADLRARHRWLMRSTEAPAWRDRIENDADYFDSKIAGWWCWGQSCWIGNGWCGVGDSDSSEQKSRPNLVTGGSGAGVHSGAGKIEPTCEAKRRWLTDWMVRLSNRLRQVRVCCGHWSRICDSESLLTRLGETGVLLDPPYPSRRSDTGRKSRDANLYATDSGADLDKLRDEVLDWCRKWGVSPRIRVAVCGLEGDGYEALESLGWSVLAWRTAGGYGNVAESGAVNSARERIWFSPACNNA